MNTVNLESFSFRVIISEAAQRAEKPSKKNVTSIGLCDLHLRATLTITMAHAPDDVL